jgi:hypothetical protein
LRKIVFLCGFICYFAGLCGIEEKLKLRGIRGDFEDKLWSRRKNNKKIAVDLVQRKLQ